jgi:tripartite-type tricarboxylate transporter receptor subunit TctC
MSVRRRALLAAPLLAPALARPAAAQDLPAGPFRLLVGFAPGGSIDTLARLVARRFADATGRPCVVENRSGAGGTIAAAAVARAAPDGTTLLLGEPGSVAIAPAVQANLPYDPLADLLPVMALAAQPVVLVTNQAGPRDLADLLARARARPGSIRNGTAGVGNPTHLFGADLAMRAGIEIEAVHYRAGGGAAAVALLNDEVQLAFAALAGALPQIRAGAYRALGTGDPAGLPDLPGVPPVASVAPGFSARFWFGLHAPRGTPEALVGALNAALRAAVAEPGFVQRMTELGYRMMPGTPAEYGAFQREEAARLGAAARAAGLRPE